MKKVKKQRMIWMAAKCYCVAQPSAQLGRKHDSAETIVKDREWTGAGDHGTSGGTQDRFFTTAKMDDIALV